MEIIAGLIGLIFTLSLIAGFVFFVIFMARKIGIINTSDEDSEGKPFVKQYLKDFKQFSQSLIFRFIFITVLIGIMTIPLGMVSNIVNERSHLYRGVINEIASTWGHRQKLQGPALLIPYTEKFVSEVVKTDKDGNERKVNKVSYKQRTAIVLPNDLKIDVDLLGQTRKRSLYESLVYTADLKITGDFQRPNINELSDHINKIHWDRAWLALGISDTQAINKVSALSWSSNLVGNKQRSNLDFEPGTKIRKILKNGFHAPINLSGSRQYII